MEITVNTVYWARKVIFHRNDFIESIRKKSKFSLNRFKIYSDMANKDKKKIVKKTIKKK